MSLFRAKNSLLPLIAYVLVAGPASWLGRDTLVNPDAVAYLRVAGYFAQGDLENAVSGYWSPLLPLLTACGITVGLDPLASVRIVLFLAGAVLVQQTTLVARRFATDRSLSSAQWAALVAIALGIACFTAMPQITPDPLLAACLMGYASLTLDPRAFLSPGAAARCGLAAGLAFLAKSFALPFFLVHWSLLAVASAWIHKGERREGRAFLAWMAGVASFLAVSGPWIAILSDHYDRPTFSTVGRIAHTIIGPADRPREGHHPALAGLHRVPEGRVTLWEAPDSLQYEHWSPFESAAYFRHQARHSAKTALSIVSDLCQFDWFHLLPLLLVAALWRARQPTLDGVRRLQMTWLIITIAVYAAPFTLVHYEVRYLKPFLWPLLGAAGATLLVPLWRDAVRPYRLLQWLFAISLAATIANDVVNVARFTAGSVTKPDLKTASATIRDRLPTGPIASPGPVHTSPGLYLAFFTERPFAGVVADSSTAAIEQALDRHGVETFAYRDAWPMASAFREATSWRDLARITDRTGVVNIYIRSQASPPRSGRSD